LAGLKGENMETEEIKKDDVVYSDPWLEGTNGNERLPKDARFVCAYEMHLIVDLFYQAAFLRRTEKTDELWTGMLGFSRAFGIDGETASAEKFEERKLSGIGRRFAVKRRGNERSASLRLMAVMSRAIHGGPEFYEGFVAPGSSISPRMTVLLPGWRMNTNKTGKRLKKMKLS
jgi:hypothetical protein